MTLKIEDLITLGYVPKETIPPSQQPVEPATAVATASLAQNYPSTPQTPKKIRSVLSPNTPPPKPDTAIAASLPQSSSSSSSYSSSSSTPQTPKKIKAAIPFTSPNGFEPVMDYHFSPGLRDLPKKQVKKMRGKRKHSLLPATAKPAAEKLMKILNDNYPKVRAIEKNPTAADKVIKTDKGEISVGSKEYKVTDGTNELTFGVHETENPNNFSKRRRLFPQAGKDVVTVSGSDIEGILSVYKSSNAKSMTALAATLTAK